MIYFTFNIRFLQTETLREGLSKKEYSALSSPEQGMQVSESCLTLTLTLTLTRTLTLIFYNSSEPGKAWGVVPFGLPGPLNPNLNLNLSLNSNLNPKLNLNLHPNLTTRTLIVGSRDGDSANLSRGDTMIQKQP